MRPLAILAVSTCLLLGSCGRQAATPGQRQSHVSPSGAYSVEMPIGESNKEVDYPVWTPTIKNAKGEVVYKDTASALSGYHNSYWDWSTSPESNENASDVLWVYNSDNGEVLRYLQSKGEWRREAWDTTKGMTPLPAVISSKINRK
jgi:hypothetical protein